MKKIITVFLLACAGYTVDACDVCGCASTGFSNYISASQNRHFVGLSYNSRSFESTHPTLFADEVAARSQEQFQTAELRGRFMPLPYLQFMGSLPLHFFERTEEGKTEFSSGIGDAILTSAFVWNTKSDTTKWKHRITIGGGIKIPTGDFPTLEELDDVLVIPNMQPGTGSLDLLFNAMHIAQINRWGLITESTYRMNNANREDFAFGDQWQGSFDVFREFVTEKRALRIAPRLGQSIAWLQQDNHNTRRNNLNPYSGGWLLESKAGVGAVWKTFHADVSASIPIYQNLGSGQIHASPRINIQFNYLIQTK